MLSKLRIGPKLLLAPGAVLILLILVAAGAWYAMVRQNDSLSTIVEQRAVRLRDTAALVHSVQRAHTDVYQLLTWLGASFAERRLSVLQGVIDSDQQDSRRRLRQLAQDTRGSATESRLVEQAAGAHALYLKAVADVIELARADASTSASAMSKAERAFDTVAARLAELSAHEQLLSEQAARRAASDFAVMSALLPLAVALSSALSLALTFVVRRALLREVSDIGNAAIDLTSGNLLVPQRAYGADEISATSRVLDTGIRNLNATLKGILNASRAINGASRQMALSIDRVSKQQATVVDPAIEGIVPIDQLGHEKSAVVAEAARAASDLQRHAVDLAKAVAGFNLDEAALLPMAPRKATGNKRKSHLRLASSRS